MSIRPGITVIVHTRNSAQTLEKCLASVHSWADELLVVDQESTDESVKIAKKFGARVLPFANVGYVEPARQMALEAVSTEWTCVLDADEELPAPVRTNITQLLQTPSADVFALPRKNMIFGEWARGGWWPDYQVRLFKTGAVRWPAELHAQPEVSGRSEKLPAKEEWAILHHNYADIDSFVKRALRYSEIAAQEVETGKRSIADHPLEAFLSDFISWYSVRGGNKSGTHGLTLSSLQSFFEVLVLTKYWEKRKFPNASLPAVSSLLDRAADEAFYWEMHEQWEKAQGWKKWLYRLRMKLRI